MMPHHGGVSLPQRIVCTIEFGTSCGERAACCGGAIGVSIDSVADIRLYSSSCIGMTLLPVAFADTLYVVC